MEAVGHFERGGNSREAAALQVSERSVEREPLARGWADQRWTLARVKILIGRLFHVGYTVEGTWVALKCHDWS
ncbi:winged helix-turn-helix domain-containing protein [Streptomyces sp. BE147]|nr:winged helix-turn-helix domain-containing protein [Streptomyces sp. BE147]MEE1737061.1 winged helix-turn-helix domain-containing protein [Streptomyces sp. BE147]